MATDLGIFVTFPCLMVLSPAHSFSWTVSNKILIRKIIYLHILEAAKKQELHRKRRTPKDMWLMAVFQGERLNLQDIAEAGKKWEEHRCFQLGMGPTRSPGILWGNSQLPGLTWSQTTELGHITTPDTPQTQPQVRRGSVAEDRELSEKFWGGSGSRPLAASAARVREEGRQGRWLRVCSAWSLPEARAAVPLQQEDLGRATACSLGPAPITITNSAVLLFHTTPQATVSSLVKRRQIILTLTIS